MSVTSFVSTITAFNLRLAIARSIFLGIVVATVKNSVELDTFYKSKFKIVAKVFDAAEKTNNFVCDKSRLIVGCRAHALKI